MQHLAREVRHRLLVEQAVVALTGLSPWIGACLLLSVPGTVLLSGRCPAAWLMVAGVALWFSLAILHLARSWPREQQALLEWDARSGRKGALASAWEFERRRNHLRTGEELHYEKTLHCLDTVRAELRTGYSWPRPQPAWVLLPLALVFLAISGWWSRTGDLQRQSRLREMVFQAQAQAKVVDTVADQLSEMSAQLAQQVPEGKGLAATVQQTAQRLQSLEPENAGSVPGELEKRARELEELARGLDDPNEPRASLAENLRRSASQIGQDGNVAATPGQSPPASPVPLPGTRQLSEHEPLLPLETSNPPPVQAESPAPAATPPESGRDQPPVPGMVSSTGPEPDAMAPVPGAATMKAANLARLLGADRKGIAGVPGLEAGAGSRELRKEAAALLDARQEDRVAVRREQEGESRVREITSRNSQNETVRATEAAAATFKRVDEPGQSGQPLPLGRREQVERYFRGLRTQPGNEP